MDKKTKIYLMIATSLVLVGFLLFCFVMASLNFDFNKLSTVQYETNEYTFTETFSNICVKTDEADIVFVPAGNGECSVVCFEEAENSHRVYVKDGSLMIESQNEKQWYNFIGINMADDITITLSLPQTQYRSLRIEGDTGDVEIPKEFSFASMDISLCTGDVKSYASASEDIKIAVTTGDIQLENISAKDLQLSVSTGKTWISNTMCNCLTSTGSTGDITLKNVIAAERFFIERTTGDVAFKHCDAGEIFVTTNTGDITGSLLTEKVFFTQTGTGSVDVPSSLAGGKCELNTSTGDIKITVG